MDTELTARVIYLIAELRRIQNELSNPIVDPKTGLAAAKLSLETTRELKAAIDGLRLFLWAYLDTWSGDVPVQHKLQEIRIEAAADMLRLLDAEFRASGMPSTAQAQRLCRQITAMSEMAGGASGRE
jgi:hypothetical protein